MKIPKYQTPTAVIGTSIGVSNQKQGGKMNTLEFLKNGSGIHIKESQKGSFTKYCHGKVTNECIAKGKKSPSAAIRKKATFAQNARRWKHKNGGLIKAQSGTKFDWAGLAQTTLQNVYSGIEQNKTINKQIEANNQKSEYLKQYVRNNSMNNAAQYYINQFNKQKQDFNNGISQEQPSDIVLKHNIWDMSNKLSQQQVNQIEQQNKLNNLELQSQKNSILGSALTSTANSVIDFLKNKPYQMANHSFDLLK